MVCKMHVDEYFDVNVEKNKHDPIFYLATLEALNMNGEQPNIDLSLRTITGIFIRSIGKTSE